MGKTVLFVDDEKQILKSIKRVFIDTDYDIYLAENGKEALEILSQNPIDVVISDMRMPVMDGYELLRQVRDLYPSIVRIILSGYSDDEVIYKAIHSNVVKSYMFKPWNGDELKDNLEEIFKVKQTLENKNVLNAINSIENLPSLPDTYIKLSDAIENDWNLDKITKIIEEDHVVLMELLHIANSSFYGLKTGSLKNVILNLGLTTTKNIVLAMKIFGGGEYIENSKKVLWEHSNLTNKFLLEMYKGLIRKNLNDSYHSAGLLHDIGKIVIAKNHPDIYAQIAYLCKTDKERTDSDIERELIGVTHNELGAFLLNWWDIPLPIVEVALYHDTPSMASKENLELVYMVHLANYYSWQFVDKNHYIELDSKVFDYLGVKKEEVDAFIENLAVEV